MLFVIVVILAFAAAVATWVTALVHTYRYPAVAFREVGRSRGGTIALIAFTGFVGGLYYWVVIRREVRPHRTAQLDPEQWFKKRGYEVVYDDADGSSWVHLRRHNPPTTMHRYGQGHSPDEAVESARRRWEREHAT
jgi:hypothetical protein